MKKIKGYRTLRTMIGSKPAHFKGGKRQWSKLITSLLIPPDPKRTWVKLENGEWERE